MELLQFIKKTEQAAGRIRTPGSNYIDRELDIDILFYGNEIIHTRDLIIPHPSLHLRAFTLFPLVEIVPGFIHPVLNKSMGELLRQCPDKSKPEKIK